MLSWDYSGSPFYRLLLPWLLQRGCCSHCCCFHGCCFFGCCSCVSCSLATAPVVATSHELLFDCCSHCRFRGGFRGCYFIGCYSCGCSFLTWLPPCRRGCTSCGCCSRCCCSSLVCCSRGRFSRGCCFCGSHSCGFRFRCCCTLSNVNDVTDIFFLSQ
jgi:hypothetical protein